MRCIALIAMALFLCSGICLAGEVRPVDYSLEGGKKLTGYLSLPDKRKAGEKIPAVLLIHGGKGVQLKIKSKNSALDMVNASYIQKNLGDRYAVFSAEYYSEYFGDEREFESIKSAYEALLRIPEIDQGRIAVIGVSHGGYLTLMCAMNPAIGAKVKCAVDVSGVVDVATWSVYMKNLLGRAPSHGGSNRGTDDILAYVSTDVGKALGWPPDSDAKTKERYAKISALSYVKNLAAPLLVIHGSGDNLVPLDQAHKLKASLQKEKKVFEYEEIATGSKGGHLIFGTSAKVWEKINAFLAKNL
jgi:dipeptidyl aminopeptidase/acylaminoacyl peptidase